MNNNLQSMQEFKKNLGAMKMMSFLLSKEQRKQLAELEAKLKTLLTNTQNFNRYFSDSGWCAYDSMNVSLMERANAAYEAGGLDAGERVLIEYYKTDVRDIMHWLKNKAVPFMERYELIQKAFEDHFAERYHASVPLFLVIIDGSVNDYTKSKGFFADGTDVTAWDCLVGCDDGLTKLKGIFNKGRNKTNHDEIRLPYRNGILHGRDLNYANEYVSCKCVALMFALADWMKMKSTGEKRKEKFEKETNPPPISESLRKMQQNKKDRQEISNWQRRIVTPGTDLPVTPTINECTDYPYIIPLLRAFSAWEQHNYGELSRCFKNLYRYEQSEKKRAGECRKMFASKEFLSFEIKEIEERACSLSRVLVQVNWKKGDNLHSEPLEFGVVYETANESMGLPWQGNGDWVINPWKVQGLYK